MVVLFPSLRLAVSASRSCSTRLVTTTSPSVRLVVTVTTLLSCFLYLNHAQCSTVGKAAVSRLFKAGSFGTPTRISHVLRGYRSEKFHMQRTRLPGTAMARAKKLGVRGHGGVTASREAAVLVQSVFVAVATSICICGCGNIRNAPFEYLVSGCKRT
jgi:hypothetical protein